MGIESNEQGRWKKFIESIRGTIQSSKALSRLINKYLAEKDAKKKIILSRKIDSRYRTHLNNKG